MSIFKDVLRGDWDAVVDKYKEENRELMMSVSGDTTMHMAARFGRTEHIRKMLGNIGETEAFEILGIKNNRGNTALHIAAELGDPAVCYSIAAKDVRLLSLPNQEGATPLFVSVANGHRDVFFTLDFLLQKARRESGQAIDYSLYKMSNGYTILHAAVFREYFGLAIQIIRIYPDLVNLEDDFGLSSLHILAAKPTAFASFSLPRFLDRIILPYLNVEQLVENELERPAVINPEYHTTPAGERPGDIENNELFQQEGLNIEDLIINHENENSRSAQGENSSNSPARYQKRKYNALPSQISFHQPGNGNMFKNICQTLLWILIKTIASVLYVGLFLVKVIPNMAGIPWLNLYHLIKHGYKKVNNLRQKKLRWNLSVILLEELVNYSSAYMNDPNHPHESPDLLQHDGKEPSHKANGSNEKDDKSRKVESPFLIAAKLGVSEVALVILNKFPVAAFDCDSELKNAALLACEEKQVEFFECVLDKYPEAMKQMLMQLDNRGNSALHLVAKFPKERIPSTPEPASLLRAEYMWYRYVKEKMSPRFALLQNLDGVTPDEIFIKTHEALIRSGSEWLLKTSESCSVVSALIATVAFATLAVDTPSDGSNAPMFLGVVLFDFYCFFGLLALCFSIISLLYFLALRTSSFRVIDFAENLPMKLFLGLMTLLLSMVCILASFCFRHYSMLENQTMKHIAIPIYVVASISVLSLATSQLPFYHGPFFQSKFREPI